MRKILTSAAAFAASAALIFTNMPCAECADVTSIPTAGIDYTESVGTILNPAAGYTNTIWAVCKPGETPVYSPTAKLVLFFIDIGAFSSGINGSEDIPLDDTFFESWKQTFENCRKNGCTVAVRFRYDANGKADPEPATYEALLAHIDQLHEHGFFTDIGEDLVFVESGFVGKWGEQHGGKYTSLEYKAKLLQKMLEVVPAPVPVTVRTPNIFAEWAGIKMSDINNSKLIDGLSTSKYCGNIQKYRSRIGLYDDGYMGSDSDLGTYSDREAETSWLSRQTLTAYFGGEFSGDLDWAKKYDTYLPENAIPEMYKTHLSYINSNIFQLYKDYTFGKEYDVEGADNSAYYGESVYNFIRDHLGYRFVLRDSSLNSMKMMAQGMNAKVDFTIENTGFAGIIPQCDSYIILEREGEYIAAKTPVNCREWLSCTKTENTVEFHIPDDITAGEWNVYFKANIGSDWTPDAPGNRAVRFANNGIWNGMLGANFLGSINIGRSAVPSGDNKFYAVGCEDGAASEFYSYKDRVTVDGEISHAFEWTDDNAIQKNENGQELYLRSDSEYLYVMAKMPEGAKAPVYNIQLHRAADNEYFWLYYASNGFIYFNKGAYSDCQCKWKGDVVEFRLPFDVFGVKGGDELKDIRVFLQDSGNDWKLMGDLRGQNVVIPENSQPQLVVGDANLDGGFTIADSVAVLQHIGNRDKYCLTSQGLRNADIDGQAGVTANDALVMQKVDAGIYKLSDLPLK